VARYGGDEFLCAMPNLRREAAAKRMTAIAATLSAAETGHSISFGLAELQSADGVEELVARADADLLAFRRARGQDA
ncbi:MAG TPA: diguanylate cyclase, partial [Gaiellaceae bacterium]